MGSMTGEHKELAAYVFAIVSLAAMLFRVNDEYFLLMPAAALSATFLSKDSTAGLNATDILLSALTLSDVISCFYSRCAPLSIRHAVFSVFCLGFYFMMRHAGFSFTYLQANKINGIRLATLIFHCTVITAQLLAIASFFIFRESVLSAGFHDTYHFRALYRPLGYICNVWAETGIALLGISFLNKKYMTLTGFIATVAILLTFSRGAYLATAVFAVCLILSAGTGRQRLKIAGTFMASVITVVTLCPAELQTAVSGNATQSQRRSTEWRINTARQAMSIIREAPLTGHGNGSFSLVTDKVSRHDSTGQFTPFAPNIITQSMVEKGLVGMILMCMTTIPVTIKLFRHRKDHAMAVTGCTMLALAVKEMTQATLSATPFAVLLCYSALAFVNNEKAHGQKIIPKAPRHIITAGIITAWLAALATVYADRHDTGIIANSFERQKEGNQALAASCIMTAFSNTPSKIEQGILLMKCYKDTKDPKYARKAEKTFLDVRAAQDEDLQTDLFLACLYLWQDKPEKALTMLERPVMTHPENGIYRYYMAEAYRQMGMDEQATACLTKAVMDVPRLLDTKNMRDIMTDNPDIYHGLYANIMQLADEVTDPKDCARYGYILNTLGKKREAAVYLKKAAEALPSLSTPWRLLGDTGKYELLTRGAFQYNNGRNEAYRQEDKELTDYDLLKMGYELRFNCWYGRDFII